MYTLSFKPTTRGFGEHDPSAVIFEEGELVFGVEEERISRNKHAVNEFPVGAIRECLDYCGIGLSDVDKVILPYKPELVSKLLYHNIRSVVTNPSILAGEGAGSEGSNSEGGFRLLAKNVNEYILAKRGKLTEVVKRRLEDEFDVPSPPVRTLEHHLCHAASAYYPSGFDDCLVVTLDGRGEYDSTVVWNAENGELERVKTYPHPNSLGHFYGIVTEYLGYHAFNGEGKVMGLAPYGDENKEIREKLEEIIEVGAEYDMTRLTTGGIESGVGRLESLFGRDRNNDKGVFNEWHEDLAFTVQTMLEETVVELVEKYLDELDKNKVALTGGVALNCKMNKRVMESDAVDDIFIQPIAHDAGLAVGAGMVENKDQSRMDNVYYGPKYTDDEIRKTLKKNKIQYDEPEALERTVAEHIADGELVGWFQGSLEMGPRALGNRSILADPRTEESRDRVNKYVKHREEWRPFAPSMLEEAADDYLVNAGKSPYMIKTFDVKDEAKDEVSAVLHPGDETTRPQTVNEEQNPRYYHLISEFEDITGVPVVLNTSFNDHGEPIVNTPTEAIKDFYGMGLDILVLGDFIIQK